MKTSFILILLLLISEFSSAQNYAECSKLNTVTSDNGLIIRKEDSSDSEKLFTLSYGQEISVCKHSNGKKEIVNNIEGRWLAVMYQDIQGYVFSAYLKESEQFFLWSMDEVGLALGEGRIEDLTFFKERYLGLFDTNPNSWYQMKEIDLRDYINENNFLIRDKIKEDGLIYITNGNLIQSDITGKRRTKNGGLPLARTIVYRTDSISYALYALGNIVLNQNNELDPISSIDDFRIILRRIKNGILTEQELLKTKMIRWSPGEFLGGVSVDWMGDLDGDGELDILFRNVAHHECYSTQLFLSSKAENGYLLKLAKEDIWCGG